MIIIYSIFRCMLLYFDCFFFFKQKTAYEMRISDWSSDVCSSDLLLKSFASRLKDIFAGDGVVARLGGDEFAILIENVESRQQLADLANRVLTIRETLFAAGRSLECGVSIGVAAFPEDGRVATELLRHADLALYRAKSLGRGRMQIDRKSTRLNSSH